MNSSSFISKNWNLKLYPNPTDLTNEFDFSKSIPATIPGCIHLDLISAGVIKDISIDGLEEDQKWIWRIDSVYSTVISQQESGANYILKFHGLDTLATIKIDGVAKLETKNMHRSYLLDVTKELIAGDVDLEIHFAAPLTDAEEQLAKLGVYPRPYEMPYNYQRKMACSYGWDWGPITISSGIWKPVELISFKEAALIDFAALTEVNESGASLKIKPNFIGELSNSSIKVTIFDDEKIVSSRVVSTAEANLIQFKKLDVKLWQPRGRGEQKLYKVILELFVGNDVVQSQEKSVGFRKIELDTSIFEGDKHNFALKVNGQRIWIRGANWIPDDPFPTRVTRERYEKRITDMLEANINGIRVWGGGIYESEDFYELCDREGIVVWQDFLFACAAYPETDEKFSEVKAEVEEAVARLGSHASLIMWCGGNECIEGFQHWGWPEILQGRPWGEKFYLETIPNQLRLWDNTRPYIPGSPFSTHEKNVKTFNSGTNHIWDVWNELGYERYEEYSPAFAAEFGYNGPGSWSMLTKAIGNTNLDSKDLSLALHQKAFDGMQKIAAGLKREFQNPPTEGPAWYFAAALVQARAVGIGLKHFRSLYKRCSGTILWQFNDMWPALSWAVLDHTGFRKLAWHAMKSAYQPRAISIGRVDQGAQLTIINDSADPWQDEFQVTLIDIAGNIVEKKGLPIELNPFNVNRKRLTDIFPVISHDDFDGFLHVQNKDLAYSRRTTLKPAISAPKPDFEIKSEIANEHLKIEIKAKSYLHELSILPELFGLGANVDKQLISLLSGQSVTFEVNGPTETLQQIENSLEQAIWSHNHLLNL